MPNKSVEEIIRRAMQDGKFDDLPGKGKPLQLDQNPHEDPEWRAAHYILKTGGFSLPWIESLNEIETNLLNARSALTQAWKWRKGANRDQIESQLLETQWERSVDTFQEQIESINKQIRSFNLEVPNVRFQLPLLNAGQEIERITGSPQF
ncbi:DnaJ family domain-containing protein [Chloroflexota bacterium]